MDDYRQLIVTKLRSVMLNEQVYFKRRAYQNAIDAVLTYNADPYEKITVDDKQALFELPGIGAKMKLKISEIFDTGTLKVADEADVILKAKEAAKTAKAGPAFVPKGKVGQVVDSMEDPDDPVTILKGIYGVGPKKAESLVADNKITSIQQLRKEVKTNRSLLNDKQTIGLKYYESILERIPRSEMVEHERYIKASIDDGMWEVTIVGSYRRGVESSGDIDVLITPVLMDEGEDQDYKAEFGRIIHTFIDDGYIVDDGTLAFGDHKFMGICSSKPVTNNETVEKFRRLDLLIVPREQLPFALLYFTGSGEFNRIMRGHALCAGYTMNEHKMELISNSKDKCSEKRLALIDKCRGKRTIRELSDIKTEADIFAFLSLKYKRPEERIDSSSVQLIF